MVGSVDGNYWQRSMGPYCHWLITIFFCTKIDFFLSRLKTKFIQWEKFSSKTNMYSFSLMVSMCCSLLSYQMNVERTDYKNKIYGISRNYSAILILTTSLLATFWSQIMHLLINLNKKDEEYVINLFRELFFSSPNTWFIYFLAIQLII